MRILVMAIAMGAASGFAAPALTNPQTYCELFSKDYADGRSLDVDHWQIDYRNAFGSCMTQYALDAPAVRKGKDVENPGKKVAGTATRPRPKRTPLLAPGSVAWNEYCAAKYASYNKATGTYKSYSGRAKPCLVPSG